MVAMNRKNAGVAENEPGLVTFETGEADLLAGLSGSESVLDDGLGSDATGSADGEGLGGGFGADAGLSLPTSEVTVSFDSFPELVWEDSAAQVEEPAGDEAPTIVTFQESQAMDMGGQMDGGMDGHMGGGMIPPPGPGASAAEIDAYVAAVKALPEGHSHDPESGKAAEHSAAMHLAARADATHVAIADGDWFDPATWYNGAIPGAGARVLIPEGVDVHYEGVSDARLFTLRVDGSLDFATDADSRMVFDTMVVSATGALVIGTEEDPVRPDAQVELIVANNGAIDTAWDPMLLSRGIISHGTTSIHGMEKDSHEKVIADPMAGSKVLEFAEIPQGWQVGDTLVIAGTRYEGHKWSHDAGAVVPYPSEDEVRTIKAIKGTKVILDAPLEHDHDSPRADLKTSVANMTRNVTIQTEDGANAEVWERGHVMFMHNDDVDVRYAAFRDLGRTDKSQPSHDISDFETVSFDSNVQGRYSVHLHRAGTADLDDPAILVGNAVWGSPGWGYVHHDSNAVLENNASFDTFGAGYVAETGNETGRWHDNIAIYAEGVNWGIAKNTSILSATEFDTGRGGDGFWFQGRLVEATDNVAASVNTGFVYFHRDGDDRMIPVQAENFAFPDALLHEAETKVGHVSILDFSGNETFAANRGLEVVKANPTQGHDVWSQLDSLTAWNVVTGARLEYTAHYILRNFDLIAKEPTLYSPPGTGISFGKSTAQMVVIGARIEGFETGVNLKKEWTFGDFTPDQHDYTLIDVDFVDIGGVLIEDFDPALDEVTTRSDLPGLAPDLVLDPLHLENDAVVISGTKTDTLGTVEFPGGPDAIMMKNPGLVKLLETDGYWTTSSGEAYVLLDVHFTDRVTGEIFYETHPVFFDEVTAGRLGQPWWQYSKAVHNGVQDIVTVGGELRAGDTVLDKAVSLGLVMAPPLNEVEGTAESERLRGSTSEDRVCGLAGDDTLLGRKGADILEGNAGQDILRGQGGTDEIRGGKGNDLLIGGGGDDSLHGDGGADTLLGWHGADILFGGAGRDLLAGGAGRDRMTGGAGADIFEFAGRHGFDEITDFTDGQDLVRYEGTGLSFEDLTIRAVDEGTLIVSDEGRILLLRVDASEIDADDFLFV